MTSGDLAEESRELTTFIIPQGRYAYNVTLMDLQPSGDTYNQKTRCLIEGENTGNLKSLDNMAGGEDGTQGMWTRIKNLCETCKNERIILNPDKFTVGRRIDFGGFSHQKTTRRWRHHDTNQTPEPPTE